MRRVLACSLFLGLASLLLGADDPFAGTWKLNLEKSKFPPSQPGRAIKEETLTIEITSDDGTVTMKGTREDGSAVLVKYSTPLTGGPVKHDSPLPAGMTVTSKRPDQRTVEMVTTRDGKEVSTQRNTVSADGKTLRAASKALNAQGETVESLAVWEKP
jgi:hypothetical protein